MLLRFTNEAPTDLNFLETEELLTLSFVKFGIDISKCPL